LFFLFTITFFLIYHNVFSSSLFKINGYVYGNLPDFPVYEGERVVFYSLGLNLGIHIIAVQGQTLMVKDRRLVTDWYLKKKKHFKFRDNKFLTQSIVHTHIGIDNICHVYLSTIAWKSWVGTKSNSISTMF
jgi:hypothetical protein